MAKKKAFLTENSFKDDIDTYFEVKKLYQESNSLYCDFFAKKLVDTTIELNEVLLSFQEIYNIGKEFYNKKKEIEKTDKNKGIFIYNLYYSQSLVTTLYPKIDRAILYAMRHKVKEQEQYDLLYQTIGELISTKHKENIISSISTIEPILKNIITAVHKNPSEKVEKKLIERAIEQEVQRLTSEELTYLFSNEKVEIPKVLLDIVS